MPEYPEMEAWRRAARRSGERVPDREGRAGAHRDAEDLRPAALGARGPAVRRRRAPRQAPPLSDGRRRARPARPLDDRGPAAGTSQPATTARRSRRSTSSSRAARSSCSPRRARRNAPACGSCRRSRPRPSSGTSGPRRLGLGAERLAEICAADSRRLHSLLRDQRAIAGIGRAWANEILHAAQLSPYALTRELEPAEIERLAAAIDSELARGPRAARARREGRPDVPRPPQARRRPATPAGARSPRSTSRSTRSSTAPRARPAAGVLKDRRLSHAPEVATYASRERDGQPVRAPTRAEAARGVERHARRRRRRSPSAPPPPRCCPAFSTIGAITDDGSVDLPAVIAVEAAVARGPLRRGATQRGRAPFVSTRAAAPSPSMRARAVGRASRRRASARSSASNSVSCGS